ncbi:MAG TPA: methyltransferase domain-containing protein [Pseudonocardiaceae bacterium]|nr:methyltransferase domain-containing protein [Pseudonocardiaceae bacterium]
MSFDAFRQAARRTYGADAAGYQEGRPDYPPRVYEVLRSTCGLGPGSRVLEIGPGSGLVTGHLVAAGARVVAVEPDLGFAEYLGRAMPQVRVVGVPFEEADVVGGFDAVVAATSFHWLDQSTALPKLGDVLRPSGWAAIWWTVFSDPYRDDPLLAAAKVALGFEPGNQRGGTAFQLDTAARCDDLRHGAGLVDVVPELIPWDLPMNADQVRALFNSMMTVRQLPDEERSRVLDTITDLVNDRFGGTVTRPHLTALYVGRKHARPPSGTPVSVRGEVLR